MPIDFALLGHPANLDHLADLLAESSAGFVAPSRVADRAGLSRALEETPAHATGDELTIDLPDGGRLSGRLIVCTFLPETVDSPKGLLAAHQKTREGVALARDLGAKIVGLGGFTSIVGGTQGEATAREMGIAVTSGNTLTAGLALGQLADLLGRLDLTLGDRTVAVLGASGDIGRACSLALAPEAGRLLLFARNRAKLDALRSELPAGADVRVVSEVGQAAEASIVIAAAGSAQPLLDEAGLRPGTIVCDIGYPRNVSPAPSPRSDTLVFSGGLAEMPFSLGLARYTRLPAPNLLHGCFAETIALAMSGRYESFSIGQGRITEAKVRAILALAIGHGFRPAPPYRQNQLMTEADLARFRQSASRLSVRS